MIHAESYIWYYRMAREADEAPAAVLYMYSYAST